MADFLESKKDEIRRRVEELRPLVGELERLEAALAALEGGSAAPARRTASKPRRTGSARKSSGTGRRGRPKGSGTRGKQALEVVTKNPGITIPEIAEAMGIQQNYLYRVMPELQKDGKVRKEGRGWHPATTSAPAEAEA